MRPHPRPAAREGGIQVNGAHSLLNTLMANGVDVCFANPGTSEMHFVAALDQLDVCAASWACSRVWSPAPRTGTGGWPTDRRRRCSHLGPGLANGLSNLHNAMPRSVANRERHWRPCTYHRHYDAP